MAGLMMIEAQDARTLTTRSGVVRLAGAARVAA